MVTRGHFPIWATAFCLFVPTPLWAQAKFYSTPERHGASGARHTTQLSTIENLLKRKQECSAGGLRFAPTHSAADTNGCTFHSGNRRLTDELRITGNAPLLRLSAESAPANQRNYQVQDSGGTLYFGPTDDNWGWQGGHITMDRSLNLSIPNNLTVGGYFKVGATAAPCNATTEGAIKYNPSSKKVEGCNGASWQEIAPEGGEIWAMLYYSGSCEYMDYPKYLAYHGIAPGSPQDPLVLYGSLWGKCHLGQTCPPDLTLQHAGAGVYLRINSDPLPCLNTPPQSLTFTDKTNQSPGVVVESDAIKPGSGFHNAFGSGTSTLSVSGQGNPQLQINGGPWVTSAAAPSGNNWTMKIRTTAPATPNTTHTVAVRAIPDNLHIAMQWKVTTGSGPVMKVTWAPPVGDGPPTCNHLAPTHYAYNYSQAQLQAAGWGTKIISTCTLGGTCDPRLSNTTTLNQFVGPDVYYIEVNGHLTGCPLDITPDPFSFTDLTNQPLNQYVQSETITLNHFYGHDNVPLGSLNISISGQGSPQLRVNNGGWVTNSNMYAGSTVQLRMMTSGLHGTEQTTTVTIGNSSVNWKVTTIASVAVSMWQASIKPSEGNFCGNPGDVYCFFGVEPQPMCWDSITPKGQCTPGIGDCSPIEMPNSFRPGNCP